MVLFLIIRSLFLYLRGSVKIESIRTVYYILNILAKRAKIIELETPK